MGAIKVHAICHTCTGAWKFLQQYMSGLLLLLLHMLLLLVVQAAPWSLRKKLPQWLP